MDRKAVEAQFKLVQALDGLLSDELTSTLNDFIESFDAQAEDKILRMAVTLSEIHAGVANTIAMQGPQHREHQTDFLMILSTLKGLLPNGPWAVWSQER